MIISKAAKENFVFKTRIDFTLDGNDEYVVLRELNTAEQNQILTAGKVNAEGDFEDMVGMLTQAEKLFPKCVVEHSGVDEEGKPVSGNDFYEQLRHSATLFDTILNTWMKSKRIDVSIKGKEGGNPLA